MEFIDTTSAPATIGELDVFTLPPTQTVVESSYEVEFRPIGSLENARTIDFSIPSSEYYTDLTRAYFHAKVVVTSQGLPAGKTIEPVFNFASSLFEQVDVYLGTVNITPGGNVYHYQAFLEDLLFKHPSPLDKVKMIESDVEKRKQRIKDGKEFDLIFSLHSPIFQPKQ